MNRKQIEEVYQDILDKTCTNGEEHFIVATLISDYAEHAKSPMNASMERQHFNRLRDYFEGNLTFNLTNYIERIKKTMNVQTILGEVVLQYSDKDINVSSLRNGIIQNVGDLDTLFFSTDLEHVGEMLFAGKKDALPVDIQLKDIYVVVIAWTRHAGRMYTHSCVNLAQYVNAMLRSGDCDPMAKII